MSGGLPHCGRVAAAFYLQSEPKAEMRKCKKSTGERSPMAVAASERRFYVKVEMNNDWQNLSIWVSESVILGGLRVTEEVTMLQKPTENTEVSSRRPSDFRHLGLWPLECDSTCELVIQPNS